MVDIVEILVYWHAGRNNSEIAQSLGVDRKTTRKYVAAAKAAGMRSGGLPVSEERWAELVRAWFPELADSRLRQVTWPAIGKHHDYFGEQMAALDGEAVAAAFGIWLKAQVMAGLADAAAVIVALDGKTVRGARTKDGKAPHLLAAMICGARAVLAQKDVDQKTNEITQVKPLLDDVDITGALVTADALHMQKETARYIVEDKGADYLFTAVKDNQPSLFAALDALDWENTPVTHVMHDRGHGRDETRTLQVLSAPGTWGVTVATIHQRLRDQRGLAVSVASLRRYVRRTCRRRRAGRRLRCCGPGRLSRGRRRRSITGGG